MTEDNSLSFSGIVDYKAYTLPSQNEEQEISIDLPELPCFEKEHKVLPLQFLDIKHI